MPEITVLPAQGCRRSRKILEYLEQHAIPFSRIDLESDEGQVLAERYGLRASPGILVDGQAINPFDLLIQPQCRVNQAAAQAVFQGAASS
jgi:glutaredoxin